MDKCILCGAENQRPKSQFCSRACEKKHKRNQYRISGKCLRCGSAKENYNISVCNRCTQNSNKYYINTKPIRNAYGKNKRNEAKKIGLCTICRRSPSEDNMLTCHKCHTKAAQFQNEYRSKPEYPRLLLLSNAKTRAKQFNVPFDLNINDITIPETCPILGMPLKSGKKNHLPSSPSLDRIIPELGYVRGNVCVISYKANQMKSDLTKDMIIKLLDYIEKRSF